MAKAMASEAGVPFLFVSSSAFQSMYYGQTNRKIRSYFKALRKAARREGGAIGFIEEIDAIGAARTGMGGSTGREGISGVVNELLIQLQSFDTPPAGVRLAELVHRVGQPAAARRRASSASGWRRRPTSSSSAPPTGPPTSTPPCCAPGRFDRSIYFDLPSRAGRREIIDYYLAKKAHDPELDDPARRDTLAAMTSGYSPVMIEHLLDEALVWALRRGADRLSWADIQQAKMTEEIGLAQPVEYTEAERRTIATHESGHATVAWLVGKSRKLEVLSIIKRKDALGLLAHSDREERFLKSRVGAAGAHPDRPRRPGGRGALLRRDQLGPLRRPQGRHHLGGPDDREPGHGRQPVLLRGHAHPERQHRRQGGVLRRRQGRDRADARDRPGEVRGLLAEHRDVVEALRDALLERDELIGDEILDVILDNGSTTLARPTT